MPYKSKAQAAYFHIHKKELERQGVNVDEWDEASKGKKLPERVKKDKKASLEEAFDQGFIKAAERYFGKKWPCF